MTSPASAGLSFLKSSLFRLKSVFLLLKNLFLFFAYPLVGVTFVPDPIPSTSHRFYCVSHLRIPVEIPIIF